MTPVIPTTEDGPPVTQTELSHLETYRPDDGHSGYKNVFRDVQVLPRDGRGYCGGSPDRWKVKFFAGGLRWKLAGTFCSPREAAKALVRFYRDFYGPNWMQFVENGRHIGPPRRARCPVS